MRKKKAEPLAEPVLIDDQDLPDGWTKKTLLEVAGGEPRLVVGGPFGSCLKVDDYQKSGIPIIRLQNVGHAKFIDKDIKYLTLEKAKELEYHTFVKGDLVLAKLGDPIGKTCIIPDKFEWGIVVSDVVRIRIENDQIDKKYLLYYLNSSHSINQISSQVFGSTRPRVNLKEVRDIVIMVPPLAEQQRIVSRVEALLSQVDAARDRLNRVPLIMKKFRQAVLAAACEGRLTEGWRGENPDVESGSQLLERIAGKNSHSIVPSDDDPPVLLPEIPESWEWSRCLLLSDPNRDITYGVIKLGIPTKSGIPTLRSSDVRWLHIDNSDVKTINPDIASQYSRTFLKGGEIVITVRGSLGGIAVVPQSMAGYNISREVAVLPLLSDLDAKYFSYAIASIWSQNWLSEVTKGVAYTGINIRDLKRLPLPLPPLPEQHEIVRRVGLLFEHADAIDREVAAAGRRCERMTQAVLAKAFSGRL